MRKLGRIIIVTGMLTMLPFPAWSQNGGEIEAVLKQSKMVDTRRDLKATLGAGGEVIVSTYCDTKAGDRDCKITSLLMLKELNQRWKNITQVRVSFYDQLNALKYRTVVVNTRHSQLVDSGKPIGEVLTTVPIAAGLVQNSSTYRAASVKPGAYFNQRKKMANEIQDLISRGARPDRCINVMAQFEQACATPGTDPRMCANLYHSLLSELDNQQAHVPRQSERKNSRKEIDAAMAKNGASQIIERVRNQVTDSGGDTSAITNTIQDIERTIRNSAH